MPGIFSIYSHMDDGSCSMAINIRDADVLHQLIISCRYFFAVYRGNHAVPADLLNICHPGTVKFFSIGFLQALADRMGRCALGQGCVFDQLGVLQFIMVDAIYLKYSLGQGSCLIKYYNFCLGKDFQVVGTFHQNSCFACSADPGKEA